MRGCGCSRCGWTEVWRSRDRMRRQSAYATRNTHGEAGCIVVYVVQRCHFSHLCLCCIEQRLHQVRLSRIPPRDQLTAARRDTTPDSRLQTPDRPGFSPAPAHQPAHTSTRTPPASLVAAVSFDSTVLNLLRHTLLRGLSRVAPSRLSDRAQRPRNVRPVRQARASPSYTSPSRRRAPDRSSSTVDCAKLTPALTCCRLWKQDWKLN